MAIPIRIENGLHELTAAHPGAVSPWRYRLQRFVKTLVTVRSQQKSLRHVETLSLGAKRSIHLVECEGQRFLVTDGLGSPVLLAKRSSMGEAR